MWFTYGIFREKINSFWSNLNYPLFDNDDSLEDTDL